MKFRKKKQLKINGAVKNNKQFNIKCKILINSSVVAINL